MSDKAIEVMPTSSSAPQDIKPDFKTVSRVHRKSFDIAKQTFPEHHGILGRFRNRGLFEKRRKLAREITLPNIVTELRHKHKEEELIREGEVDPLTQIYNRKGFLRRASEEQSRLGREKAANPDEETVVFFFDGDNFKQVNDTLGHDEGDRVLQRMSQALQDTTRDTDIVGRLGGDEFAVIMPGISLKDSVIYWERLSKVLEARGLKMSAGASVLHTNDLALSLREADTALYDSKDAKKASGRSEFSIYYGQPLRDPNLKGPK
jgi:diguanylate cyclase (GGDEF)-like protein